MTRLIAVAAVVGTALAVPSVRARALRLLARAGRGTTVRVVPAPDRR
ncbi:hypothetical protein ACI8AF_00400 [Blastococcus sp. SYSU D00669]